MKKMSLQTLEKLENNPAYKLSEKQKAQLAEYRATKFKNNPAFIKHPTNLEEHNNAKERTDGKTTNSN